MKKTPKKNKTSNKTINAVKTHMLSQIKSARKKHIRVKTLNTHIKRVLERWRLHTNTTRNEITTQRQNDTTSTLHNKPTAERQQQTTPPKKTLTMLAYNK